MHTNDTARTEGSARTAAASALGLALIGLTLAGCSVVEPYMPEQQEHWDSYSDAPSEADSQDAAWFLPAWVPEDAEDIDVRLDTSDPGYAIAFTSATGVDTAACTALDGPHGGPAMTAGFLPDHLPTTGLVTCGDGRVTAEVDGRWYGWTPAEPIATGSDDTLRMP